MKNPPSAKITGQQVRVVNFKHAREILRSGNVRQAGFNAELLERFTSRTHAPVLYQEGEAHQRQRSATARFFAPRVVSTRYRDVMEQLSRQLVQRFLSQGRAQLDDLSLQLAVAVASDIIGLTDSSRPAMARRLSRFFSTRDAGSTARAIVNLVAGQTRLLAFYLRDVRPAIRTRRSRPQEDLISHLISEDYSNREILTECLTYAAAGMATTREFIVMATLKILDDEPLKNRFLETDETGQSEILEEILRLEPVVSLLKRRVERDIALDGDDGATLIAARSLVEIDVCAVNRDPSAAGSCPDRLDASRTRGAGVSPSIMSFGDGPHRCPGASVALQETAIFLNHLLRTPGIRFERLPTRTSNPVTAGYELRDAIIICEKAGS